ncbi:uncharacterized protein LOC126980217 [Eriocheir sinensis]|uniref:uncharacterized protein LOC126980217 n=1 Tax=Eriocheir sinensis TaxID=95602 RepID=UPI0021C91A4D|nr:uncharacterized protein LOC126980217 [Eriocheir sinensis]
MTNLLPPPPPLPLPTKSLLLLLLPLLLLVLFVQPARGVAVNYDDVPAGDAHLPRFGVLPDTLILEQQEQHRLDQEQPWIALVLALTKLVTHLAEPYVGSFPNLPIDWTSVIKNINYILDKSSFGIGPLRAAVVGVVAMAVPVIMQVGRTIVDVIASLLDNTVYVVTGHGLGRRSMPNDVMEELSDVALRLVHLVSRHLGR